MSSQNNLRRGEKEKEAKRGSIQIHMGRDTITDIQFVLKLRFGCVIVFCHCIINLWFLLEEIHSTCTIRN